MKVKRLKVDGLGEWMDIDVSPSPDGSLMFNADRKYYVVHLSRCIVEK